jgi:AraC family transcriptional regulator
MRKHDASSLALTASVVQPPAGCTDAPGILAAQQHGGLPEVAVQSSPTDRYGVALARISYAEGVCLSGMPPEPLIGIICSAPVRTEHRIADQRLHHESGPGSLCICPAGADYVTAFDGPVDGIVMRISAECLALAKAQFGVYGSTLAEQLDGRDEELMRIAQTLEAEATAGHPNGMLFWNSIADALLRHLATHHLSVAAAPLQGALDAQALRQLNTYISENLAEPLDLAELAAVVGCDRFHFAHRFRAKVGISPHRYVVRLRLERARELLCCGEEPLAQVAAATGFADQSHLSNWVRRIYGTSPARLAGSR